MAEKKPAKKAAAKKAPARKKTGQPKIKGRTRRPGSGKKAGDGDSTGIPKGKKGLTTAQKSLRDTLIVQRKAQGWTWEEISAEIELSVSACKRAYKSKKAVLDDLLERDPIEVVKQVIEGFQTSIGDLEKMAVEYSGNHPSAAVGAKKGADEARRNLIQLLQSLGALPQELGTMRFVVEIRQVVELMVTSITRFEKRIDSIKMPPKHKKEVMAASGELRKTLKEAAGQTAE
jgi:hypothetical protein